MNSSPPPTRPRTEAGYGISTKPEGLLDWSELSAAFARSHNYWVTTTRSDGRPHAAPVWGVWLNETLYFSTGEKSVKGRNLARNPEVVAHLESGDDVFMLEGTVETVTDRSELESFVDAYEAKYALRLNLDEPIGIFYAVRPRLAHGWHEKNFPESATTWRFD